MSKYIKIEDAIEEASKPTSYTAPSNILAEVTKRLQSLPTIEVNDGETKAEGEWVGMCNFWSPNERKEE